MTEKSFESYLLCRGISASSRRQSQQHLQRFFRLVKEGGVGLREVDYSFILNYLNYERRKGIKEVSLRHYLRYVRWYYDYLLSVGKVASHPLRHVNLRRHYQNIKGQEVHSLLSEEDLELVYESYMSKGRLNSRNGVLLGLLIYQGIAIEELGYLRVKDLDLGGGMLRVVKSKRHESRDLELASKQILLLLKYIGDKKGSDLLISYESKSQGRNSRVHLCKQIKRELKQGGHGKVGFKNLVQLRRSVISNWVRQYNLREAQYMAGHKWVISTESYQLDDLVELQEQVDLYHPLG